jgi:hypothetical protein
MANNRMMGIGTPNSHNKIPRPMIASSSFPTRRVTPKDLAWVWPRDINLSHPVRCRADPNSTRAYTGEPRTPNSSQTSLTAIPARRPLYWLKEYVHCTAFEAVPSRTLRFWETLRMKGFRDGSGSLGARVPVTIDFGLSERGLRIAKRVPHVG